MAEILAGAVTAAVKGLGLVLTSPRGRKRNDIDVARWLDIRNLTLTPPELSSGITYDELTVFLHENTIQAILQELLAARLTDAPETEAERLAELFTANGRRRLSAVDLSTLFGFFDDQICSLVARVSSSDSELLHQIRRDAYLSRVVAAIERHAAVAQVRPYTSNDRDFIGRYRRHVTDFHGRLQPPDFERRRLIPIENLYVSPPISQIIATDPGTPLPKTDIWQIGDELDHAVLLGDPGGGKTTAANALMHRNAVGAGRRIPFLVILREFAASDSPERSVLAHIEHKLEVFYQCRPPERLIESLLLDGSAFVIFDGLDELLDTSRRSEIAAVIEQFCSEYPLSRVLVTSRTVGYDQARLDDGQFKCFRIDGFDVEQVAEYANKWFSCQDGIDPSEADSFLDESANVSDIRSNPLMLALMCILYRGEGSIPHSRPEIYEKCANLLFYKWDASRKIYLELRARNLIEPAIRHLAYWLFANSEAQPVVTEQELVSRTAAYFVTRGFEQRADAEAAAREFVEFCRGRLWVFTEAGTAAHGEALYAFTHRTFLEYFAATYLASIYDSPEQLARNLSGRVARSEWDTVAQLAVQIKDHTSERGADRIFRTLLTGRRYRSTKAIGNILGFLGRCSAFAEILPATARKLAAQAFKHALADISDDQIVAPLAWLMVNARGARKKEVAAELEARIHDLVESGNSTEKLLGLRLALQISNAPFAIQRGDEAWHDWDVSSQYEEELMRAAESADDIAAYLCYTPENIPAVLAHRTDLPHFLFEVPYTRFLSISWFSPARHALSAIPNDLIDNPMFNYFNKLLAESYPPSPVVVRGREQIFGKYVDGSFQIEIGDGTLSMDNYRSAAYIMCVFAEIVEDDPPQETVQLGCLEMFHHYLIKRWRGAATALPLLPVDERWQETFAKWANKKVDFTAHH